MNKATVKLLALLEERGVTPKMIPFELDAIAWQGDICKWVAVYDEDEEAFAVAVYENYLSAEQAIAATLGIGTCEVQHVKSGAMYDVWRYTCCGYEHAERVSEEAIPQNFCPNCGKRVSA